MDRKTVVWIVILAFIAAASAGAYIAGGEEGTVAALYIDGELYETIDLSAVVLPYEKTIETEYGWNTVRVSHGAIEVSAADCREQVCVNQGTITDSLVPIVCLPHRLVIQIEEP